MTEKITGVEVKWRMIVGIAMHHPISLAVGSLVNCTVDRLNRNACRRWGAIGTRIMVAANIY
ncbi:hypothetical protein ADZ37_24035 [Pannonibacter phragmitetus]|uniref:Uncharacterized protein n=1 Tax=Pannonibacter phragmitetus TaxID=121719 RepID=A0A0L0IT25_9HYPH|nr:hypothetical protein APZ00_25000 [Pannonibacter phragmitetus]KND16250.1 hypothetical protein ADZ37_24035 [Pannonibacter phragmitetus]